MSALISDRRASPRKVGDLSVSLIKFRRFNDLTLGLTLTPCPYLFHVGPALGQEIKNLRVFHRPRPWHTVNKLDDLRTEEKKPQMGSANILEVWSDKPPFDPAVKGAATEGQQLHYFSGRQKCPSVTQNVSSGRQWGGNGVSYPSPLGLPSSSVQLASSFPKVLKVDEAPRYFR